MGKAIWVMDTHWDEVWALVHNIRVRMSRTVKKPGFSIARSGTRSAITLDLPEPTAGSGGGMVPAVMTSAPASGYGAGTAKKITLESTGLWTATGDDLAVVCPKIT